MAVSLHETCLEYFHRRIREGWKCISLEGYNAVLLSPDGNIRRPIDLRNDVETLRPNADGANTGIEDDEGGGRPFFDSVDEAVADDDTTYVKGSGTDTYGLPDSGVGTGTINHVTVYAVCRATAANHELRIVIYTHTTLYYGSVEVLTTDWASYFKQWTSNPNTSSAWTWAERDALEAGIELTDTGLGYPLCTQVYVEVDYTEAVTFIPTVMII